MASSGTGKLIEIGNRTPMTVGEFATKSKDAFERNGTLFVPAPGS